MANHKSAEKRIRSSKRKAQINKPILSAFRTCQKTLDKNLKDKKREELEKGLKLLFKLADRAVKRGVIKKNKASRSKSRLASRAHSLLSSK